MKYQEKMDNWKVTKGSWYIEKKLDYKHQQDVYAIGSKHNDEVLNEEFITVWTWMIEEEAEANAQLIASAPDLLEALQEMMKVYKEIADSGDCGWWKAEEQDEFIKAQKAINKAIGK